MRDLGVQLNRYLRQINSDEIQTVWDDSPRPSTDVYQDARKAKRPIPPQGPYGPREDWVDPVRQLEEYLEILKLSCPKNLAGGVYVARKCRGFKSCVRFS